MGRILVIAVLLVLAGCGSPVELPGFPEPARSVEEVARRLRPFELRGEHPYPAAGDVFQLCEGTFDPRAPAEPQGFPVLVAHLKTDPPVHARFMLMPGTEQAARLVAQAARAARGCAGPASGTLGEGMDAETTVSAFGRGGWSGTQVITSGRAGSDTDDPFFYKPFTTGQLVVNKGAWVVDLGWNIRSGFGSPGADWAETGRKVSESVLAVADGAVTAPQAQDLLTRLVGALPDPGAYGERVKVWPRPFEPRQYREQGDGPPMSNDLSCGAGSLRVLRPGLRAQRRDRSQAGRAVGHGVQARGVGGGDRAVRRASPEGDRRLRLPRLLRSCGGRRTEGCDRRLPALAEPGRGGSAAGVRARRAGAEAHAGQARPGRLTFASGGSVKGCGRCARDFPCCRK
ncbi:hypothetical protein [Nonomuraea rubra]|uniref:hypothetical protein n=1 Tax=Nonomuraea rubra TaxID=46180 RepID=UPI0033E98271